MASELSNTDLDRICGNDPLLRTAYLGTYAKDQLAAHVKPSENGFAILNLQSIGNDGSRNWGKGGSHWCVVYSVNPKWVLYADSFGFDPSKSTLAWMQATGKQMYQNSRDIQGLQSSKCGWFCVYLAHELLKGRSLADVVDNDFWPDDPVHFGVRFNDIILQEQIRQNGWI
jgi:hypothetical protein